MIEERANYQLVRVAKLHGVLVGGQLAKLGLHIGQELLLSQLWRQDGLTQSELIGRLRVEAPTVTKALQRLERAGMVRRERHPGNRRVWRVFLTDKGRALEAPVKQVWADSERQLLSGLSAEERDRVRALLDRMIANLETHLV